MLDFVDRRRRELALTVFLLLAGVAAFHFSIEWGSALILAGVFGAGYAIAFDEGQRRAREREQAELEAAEEQAGLDQMRTIAWFARELLLDASIWNDVDAIRDYADGDVNVVRKHPPLPGLEWSIAAIVARGFESFRPLEVRGWQTIAQVIGDDAARLTTKIDQEFPGQPAERRRELATLFKAATKAVEGARYLSQVCGRVRDLAPDAPFEERERARDALRDGAYSFFGACEWVQGEIEKLDDRPEFAASIAARAEEHRAVAATILGAQREIHAIAAAAAEQLLRDAAPALAYRERSSLHSAAATLREVARAEEFSFAAAEEEQALADWKARIGPAQRSFLTAVESRGGEMDQRTHFLLVQINGDCLRQLEQAIEKLGDDLRARTNAPASMVDRIEQNIAERREELRAALEQTVARVDELQAVRID